MLVDAERRQGPGFEERIDDGDDVAIAALTVAELAVGIELADGQRKARRKAFVDAVLETVSVEDYDLEVARAHGFLLAHCRRTGSPRGAHDLIIAATARARGRKVMSSDATGFADLPGVDALGVPEEQ